MKTLLFITNFFLFLMFLLDILDFYDLRGLPLVQYFEGKEIIGWIGLITTALTTHYFYKLIR